MSPAEIETMRSVEDDLWWYRGLRRHVIHAIAMQPQPFELLDAGCGSGGMLSRVRQHFPEASLTGMDFVQRALELTRERNTGAALVRGSADELPFSDDSFDIVLSLDVIVLRGIDDRKAISEMQRVLRPGGKLIINLAAFDFLRGSHDVATNMARRYTKPKLKHLLEDAGFTIEQLTYWNMSLMPTVALVRWVSRRKAHRTDVKSDLAPMSPPLNAALSAIARVELAVSRRVSLPFGTSIFAIAHK
ncbi:MAG: class I SAM-dependent methyltransferase [Chthoniobacterales bacterium]